MKNTYRAPSEKELTELLEVPVGVDANGDYVYYITAVFPITFDYKSKKEGNKK